MSDDKKIKRRSESFGSSGKVQFEDEEEREGEQKLSLSEGSIGDSNKSPGSEPSESGTLKKPKRFRPKKFIQKRLRLRPKDSKSSDEINQERGDSEISEQDSLRKSASFTLPRTSSNPTSPKSQRFSFVKKFTGRKSYKFDAPPTSSQETQDLDITLMKIDPIHSSGDEQKSEQSSDGESHVAHRSFTPSEKFFEIKEQKEENMVEETTMAHQQQRQPSTLERKKMELKITISGKKIERVDKASPSPPLSAGSLKTDSMTKKEQLENILLPAFAKNRRELSMEREAPKNPISSEVAGTFPLTFAAVVREEQVDTRTSGTKEIEKYLVLTSSLNSIISAAKELDEQTTNRRISFQDLIGTSKIEDFDNNLQHELPIDDPSTVESPDSETREKVIDQIVQETEANVEEKFAQLVEETTPEPEEIQPTEEEKEHSSINEAFSNFLKDQIHIEPEIYSSTPKSMTSDDDAKNREFEDAKSEVENLSSSPPEQEIQIKSEINFEVGTSVRAQRTSPASSQSGMAPIAYVDELVFVPVDGDEEDESFLSPVIEKSEDKSLQSLRRKIRYVPEFSNYSAEEQELLKSQLIDNTSDSLAPDSSIFPVFDENLVRWNLSFIFCLS